MLPEPMHRHSSTVMPPASRRRETGPHRAEPGDVAPRTPSPGGRPRDHRAERPGEHDIAGAQRVTGAGQLVAASQASGVQRVPEAGRPSAGRHRLSRRARCTIPHSRRSSPASRRGAVPSTNAPLEALSAIVSTMVMSQPAIRESTISIAGSTKSTARTTSTRVTGRRSRSAPSTNATSASTRGCSSRPSGTARRRRRPPCRRRARRSPAGRRRSCRCTAGRSARSCAHRRVAPAASARRVSDLLHLRRPTRCRPPAAVGPARRAGLPRLPGHSQFPVPGLDVDGHPPLLAALADGPGLLPRTHDSSTQTLVSSE